ncbi:MAG: ATP-binding cassette domain-containing protein [Streptosporangiales bacterium]|nr:ATP-binding cassette domain-containing protein [Streptosporangiales bacterium]
MIHAEGLTRHFRVKKQTVEAVRGIDLTVEEGELVAFLGPNGAGKTTTLRMLTTLLAPTAGQALVAGHDVAKEPDRVRHRIGYVGQGNGAGHSQRVRDELVTQGRCYGMASADAGARADRLLDSLDLAPLAKRTVQTLSGGQRRRLDVAMGLMHRPPLMFFAEPSTGLDPHNRANLWEHIERLRAEAGTTILLTTHYLEEADAKAERVIVIDHGSLIADGSSAELKAKLADDRITVGAADEVAAKQVADVAERLAAPGAVTVAGSTVRLRVDRGEVLLPALVRALDEAGVPPVSVELDHPTLDDVFLALTGRSLREEDADA